MRKISLMLAIVLVATSALAQVRTPRPSPSASLTQTVGVTDITIKYSRPGVKNRPIWGALVPWDKVWRTGANEATTISFSTDVTVMDQKLPKGTYSLHTIPGQNDWTIIFNSVADQWGSYSYDPAKDVVKVRTKPAPAEHTEWLTFDVPEMTTDTAMIRLRWEKVAVPIWINTGATKTVMDQLRNAMKPSWQTPYMAANFAFENRGAATDAEMNQWIEDSLKINQNIANLWLRARIAERAGNKADAIRYGEMAIAAARPDQADFASEVRRNVDKWKQ